MSSQDLLRVRGSLRIAHIPGDRMGAATCLPPDVVDTLHREGHCRVSCRYENLVVDVGLSVIRAMVGGGLGFPVTGAFGVQAQSDLDLTEMRLGSTIGPPAPAAGDVDISEVPPTYSTNTVTVFYPTPESITIVGVVPQAEATLDGVGITEEGLFVRNGAMLAHVTFPAEVKIPTHALQFEHTITFGRP